MTPETLKLYHSPASPNSRRVAHISRRKRTLDSRSRSRSGARVSSNSQALPGDQPAPRGAYPGARGRPPPSAKWPAIMRYLDEAFPEKPLLGHDAQGQGADRNVGGGRAELEGFAAVMEGVRNRIAGLKGRAIAGPHDYEQIPATGRAAGVLRVKNFFADLKRAAEGGALRRRASASRRRTSPPW